MTHEQGSVLHSWCVPSDWKAPTVTGGEGAFFRDDAGRRYLDMSSLAECMNLGHQHPAVVRAIREQAERLCFVTASWGAEPRRRLAERLLDKSGFEGGRVFFTLGGADANEHAVKFARQASGRPRRLGPHAGPLVPRRELRGDGSFRGRAGQRAGRRGGLPRRARPPSLRLSLPVRLVFGRRVRDAQRAPRRRGDRPARTGRGRGGADGAERGDERHRGAGRLLAAAARGDPPPRRLPDRGRGDERLRAVRRVVRVAASRRAPDGPT